MLTFETYQDESGEYRWRLRHENGNVVADSGEGYEDEGDRNSAILNLTAALRDGNYTTKEVEA